MELTLDLAGQVAAEVAGSSVTETIQLHGSDRSLVARVRLTNGSSVIVKLHPFRENSTSSIREPAALELATRPRLLGVSTTPPGVVMEDLGEGESLAEPLLGADPALARSRVLAWAQALAGTQVSGEGFAEALARHAVRLGTPVPRADGTPGLLDAAAEALADLLPEWGIESSPQALQELRALDDLLGGDVRRLSPTDTCPDNCQWIGGDYVLLDYESAQVRHVAWDAAYFQIPFPTCWCGWALPDGLAHEALTTWKQAFDHRYVDSIAFEQDLQVARLGWAFITLWWFWSRAVEDSDGEPPDRFSPRVRARLLRRLRDAPDVVGAPTLSQLARKVHQAMATRWGDVPLELAPAFRS